MEQRGVEPLTSELRFRRSPKLSYCPVRTVSERSEREPPTK